MDFSSVCKSRLKYMIWLDRDFLVLYLSQAILLYPLKKGTTHYNNSNSRWCILMCLHYKAGACGGIQLSQIYIFIWSFCLTSTFCQNACLLARRKWSVQDVYACGRKTRGKFITVVCRNAELYYPVLNIYNVLMASHNFHCQNVCVYILNYMIYDYCAFYQFVHFTINTVL